MTLPLPKVVADVGPGGPLITAMGGMNSLANDMLLRKINAVKAKYAPLTAQADAASKLAYANLMGPQFLAKLLANDAAVGNMGDANARASLQKAVNAGMGQSAGTNIFAQMQNQAMGPGERLGNSLSGWFADKLKGVLGQTDQSHASNPLAAMPSPQQQNPLSAPTQSNPPPSSDGINHELDAAYMDWMNSPEGQRNDEVIPSEQELLAWKRNKDLGAPSMNINLVGGKRPGSPTYAENSGAYKGVVKEGEKLGEIRAQAISDMDEQYQQAIQSEAPIDHLVDLTQAPVFQQMRGNVPFFQDKQLEALSKIGTPEEQKLVGDFVSTTTNAVANTVNSFRGRILDKEVTMANQMKVSPKDTWNVMMGKLASIKTFNEMTKQRSRIASKLMQEQHLNRGEALEIADKQVDGKAIRKQVEAQLSPKPTDEDINYMAQKYNTSSEEIRKRLQAKGIL